MGSERPMADCECLRDCSLYCDAMVSMPAVANVLLDRYCAGDHIACARYRAYMSLGEGNVPADLFPYQHDRLREILA